MKMIFIANTPPALIIDREAREIIDLVASVCPSVRLSVCLRALSRLNRLTYDLDIWHVG